MNDEIILEKELDHLKDKHSHIDQTIRSLTESPFVDQLKLMRLKREKLQLKDAIFRIEEMIYPDITA